MKAAALAALALALVLGYATRAAGAALTAPAQKLQPQLRRHHSQHQQEVAVALQITPGLEPTSSKGFFGKDYPDDGRPQGNYNREDFPFPKVQQPNRYDADYVKDENSDRNTWESIMSHSKQLKALQTEIDRIQAQIDKEMQELERLRKEAVQQGREEQYARDAIGTKRAKDEDRAKEATTVQEAAAAVSSEVDDLEECKRQLQQARDKLERLQKDAVNAQAEIAAAKQLEDAAKATEDQSESQHSSAEDDLAKAQSQYDELSQEDKSKDESLIELKKQLAVAEAKLRSFREGKKQGGAGDASADTKKTPGPPEPSADKGQEKKDSRSQKKESAWHDDLLRSAATPATRCPMTGALAGAVLAALVASQLV